jgi:hypothetical protein
LSGLSVRTIQRLERGQPASVESLKVLGAASALKEPEMNATTSQSVSADEALALAHVRKLGGFYAQYSIMIGFLTIVNLMMSHHYYWVIWVALAGVSACCFTDCGCSTRRRFSAVNGSGSRSKYLGRKL